MDQEQKESKMQNTQEGPNVAYANFYSWFLLPLMIVLIGLGLSVIVARTLYGESEDIDYWLNEIRYGSHSKRWTSAQQMAQIMMADPSQIPHDEIFQGKLINALEDARNEDHRMRYFLLSIMGMTGDQAYGETLVKSLDDENKDCVRAAINSIGLIKYAEGYSKVIKMLKESNDPLVRLDLCVTLGELGQVSAIDELLDVHANDPFPNVRWEAALALLKLGDSECKHTIAKLLDVDEYSKYGDSITDDEIQRTILTVLEAIDQYSLHDDSILIPNIINLSKDNKYPSIKSKAITILEGNG